MQSVTSNAVSEALGYEYDDDDLVDISSQVTMLLGVSSVKVRRKNNFVYMQIDGTYSGVKSTGTQEIVKSIPSKYRPLKRQIGNVLLAYNSSQYLAVGRGDILPEGKLNLSETEWANGSIIRASLIYMVN